MSGFSRDWCSESKLVARAHPCAPQHKDLLSKKMLIGKLLKKTRLGKYPAREIAKTGSVVVMPLRLILPGAGQLEQSINIRYVIKQCSTDPNLRIIFPKR